MPRNAAELVALIDRRADQGAVFIEWQDARLTYADFAEDLRRFCGLFSAHELIPGDRIVIATETERQAIGAFTAALLDGLVPIMLTPQTPAPRIAAIAALVEPGLVFIDAARSAEDWCGRYTVLGVTGSSPRRGLFGRKRDDRGLDAALAKTEPRAPRAAIGDGELAYILFTSGTTSEPKGVMVTHRNLFTHLATLARVLHYDTDSRIFNGMVLAHADGLIQGPIQALFCGCRLIRPPAFRAPELEAHLNMVRAHSATHFLTVPAILTLIDRYAVHDDYLAAPEFRFLVSVAAKLEIPLWQRLETRFGRPVINMYGLTETVASALYAGPDLGPIGTIGQPVDCLAKIVLPDGSEAEAGAPGEIWLRGDNVSPGYYRAPDATLEKFADGWLKTGDLGVEDPDGTYRIVGRLKTAIMSGGFLIQPEEIDEALLRHEAVAEVATVGLEDPDLGEIAVSAVVLDGAADEAALTAHCAAYLEPQKVPKRIAPVAEIPRGDAGKPQLARLRDLLAEPDNQPLPSANGTNDIAETVLVAAARSFRVPRETLSLDSSTETVERWDSFAHVGLIVAVESALNLRLPTREVIAVKTLKGLAEAAARQRERS